MYRTPMREVCHDCGSHRNRRGMIRCVRCNGLYHLECIPNGETLAPDQLVCLPCSTDIPASEDEGATSLGVDPTLTHAVNSTPNTGMAAGVNINNEGGARRRPIPSPRTTAESNGREHPSSIDNMLNRMMQSFQASHSQIQSIMEVHSRGYNDMYNNLVQRIEESTVFQVRKMEELESRLNSLARELDATHGSAGRPRNPQTDRHQFPPAQDFANTDTQIPTRESPQQPRPVTLSAPGSYEDLPKFDGKDPKIWIKFEATYNYQRRIGVDADRRTSHLITALSGPAYTLVADRLLLRDDPDLIVNELREHYANVDRVIRRMMNEIMKAKAPRDQPKFQLIDFAVLVKHLVTTIKYYNRREMLINVLLEEDIIDKLRDEHQDMWGKLKRDNPNANLEHLSEFILDRSKDRSAVQSERTIRKPLQPKRPTVPLNVHQDADYTDSDASSDTNEISTALIGVANGNNKPYNKRLISCFDCGENHRLVNCRTFLNRSVAERWVIVASKNICVSCISSTDHASQCPKQQTCLHTNCTINHHHLLHFISPAHTTQSVKNPALNNPSETKPIVNEAPLLAVHQQQQRTYYGIVPLYLVKSNGEEILVYAMLDTGAGMSLMSSDLLPQLQLSGIRTQVRLKWTKSEIIVNEPSQRVSLKIRIPSSSKLICLDDVHTIDELDLPIQTQSKNELNRFPHLRDLPVPEFENVRPQLLIGLPHAKLCVGKKIRQHSESNLVANKTSLGWVVYGISSPAVLQTVAVSHEYDDDNLLENLVKLSMSIDSFGTFGGARPYQSRHDQRVNEIVNRTMRQVGNRYEIGLFWRNDDVILPSSYPMAMKRMACTETAVRRAGLLEWTNNKITELVDKGYARIATANDLQTHWKRTWYLPMFVVVNPNKLPLKPRIVMDGAATVDGKSLNGYLLPGNEHPASLIGALFRFRVHKYAVSGDVKEMFHQVRIIPEDQQCQRFIWRYGIPNSKPTTFIFQNMTFGLSCSPSSAQLVKNDHAKKYEELHPLAFDALTKGTYVDDFLDSQPTVDLAIDTTLNAIRIMSEINFHLVGFQSNSMKVMSKLPEANVKNDLVALDPDPKVNQLSKILGMNWDRLNDTLVFRLNESTNAELDKLIQCPTKRQLLRVVMKLFDPLGIVSHGLIRGRMILQMVWREGIGWDSLIPENLLHLVKAFVHMISEDIPNVKIPRWYAPMSPDPTNIELHIFTDASEDAMAAVAYFRYIVNDETSHVTFVFGKTKVMPIKTLSIPKAELTAAVIGVRIGKEIIQRHQSTLSDVVYWTDSKCVLAQLNTNKKLQPFTSNRVGEILDSSTRSQWHYVHSNVNPADWGTKIRPKAMEPDCPWFTGPQFLVHNDKWPELIDKNEIPEEFLLVAQPMLIPEFPLMKSIKELFMNNWWSLRRIIARRIRFVKIKLMKKQSEEPYLTPEEYQTAEEYIFASIQSEAFPNEYRCLMARQPLPESSTLLSFRPFMTSTGVIRMTSRLENAKLSYCAKHPAILPRDHPIVTTFVRRYHEDFAHIGEESIIAAIRMRVWIPGVRNLVRKVAKNCNFCRRRNAKPCQPPMGALPEYRTNYLAYPFEHTGVDAFGPILVSMGRGRSTQKRWVIIFTCLTVRAVFFEVIEEMSSDIALCAMENFSSARGPIRHMYSDRGTNFVGVANELEKMRKLLAPKLADKLNLKWHFNPTETPHFGGAWERLIGSTKKALRIINHCQQAPNDFTLRRTLDRVAGFLNNRPLTRTPIDPESMEVLTPNHFLNLRITQPVVPFSNNNTRYLNYNKVTNLYTQVTQRLVKEYFPTLSRRCKWTKDSDQPTENELVLYVDKNKTPLEWKMVKIEKLYYGNDDVARVADIKFADNSKKRTGVVNLARLYLSTSNEAIDGVGNVAVPPQAPASVGSADRDREN